MPALSRAIDYGTIIPKKGLPINPRRKKISKITNSFCWAENAAASTLRFKQRKGGIDGGPRRGKAFRIRLTPLFSPPILHRRRREGVEGRPRYKKSYCTWPPPPTLHRRWHSAAPFFPTPTLCHRGREESHAARGPYTYGRLFLPTLHSAPQTAGKKAESSATISLPHPAAPSPAPPFAPSNKTAPGLLPTKNRGGHSASPRFAHLFSRWPCCQSPPR